MFSWYAVMWSAQFESTLTILFNKKKRHYEFTTLTIYYIIFGAILLLYSNRLLTCTQNNCLTELNNNCSTGESNITNHTNSENILFFRNVPLFILYHITAYYYIRILIFNHQLLWSKSFNRTNTFRIDCERMHVFCKPRMHMCLLLMFFEAPIIKNVSLHTPCTYIWDSVYRKNIVYFTRVFSIYSEIAANRMNTSTYSINLHRLFVCVMLVKTDCVE